MSEDRQLLKRTLNGDGAAFDEVVRRYQDGLFRHLLRLTGRAEEAEDLCQEAFIRFYCALRRFDPARPVAPFLFVIATNLWRDRLRQARPLEQPLDERQPAPETSVAEQALLRVEHEQIVAAVQRLRGEQREAVSLFYDQGLSYREIARVTRVPVGTVGTRLRLALAALRRELPREAAGLVIVAGGTAPPAAGLVSALQGQAIAPPSLAPAIAQGIAHAAPAAVGASHGIWTLLKEGVLMTTAAKAAYVTVGVAGLAVGVPRLLHHGPATVSPGVTASPGATATAPGDLPPLPEKERALFQKHVPEYPAWADRLREVYAALPQSAKDKMLRTGQYEFHLGDLAKPQADVIRTYVERDIQGSRVWLEFKYGKPLDLSRVTFRFGRDPANSNYTRFMIVGPNGYDRAQPEIGLWPGSAPGR
jgi:RNA polymerase sigma-70 factor (ECF subfamily)